MNFISAVKSVFSQYATFTGRARRSEFWYFVLFNIVVSFVISMVAAPFDPAPSTRAVASLDDVMTTMGDSLTTPSSIASLIFSLITLVPSYAVQTRRLHDIGKSGWYVVAGLVLGLLFATCCVVGIITQNFVLIAIGGFLSLIAVAYDIYLIVLYCRDSQFGANRYGENPKGETGNNDDF